MTRRELERLLHRSLQQMDLSERVAAALPRLPARRVRVLAVGKAAPAMAAGAMARWEDAIVEVVVVTTDGTETLSVADDPRVEVIRARHPIPDARSLRAAERCLAVARSCAEDGAALLVLVSGGASALLCAPAEGVRLEDKRNVTRAMLASGATIQEINVVRKHLSRIKGGGLARAAAPAHVLTLVASDVIGGTAADVGSGPSIEDLSRVAAARTLLRRHAAALADLPLARTGTAPNARRPRIVASPEELARVVADELRERGLRVTLLAPSQSSVEDLAREYLSIAATLGPQRAIVRAAEPSIEVRPRTQKGRKTAAGRGGRSSHLATLVGRSIPPGVMFLAAATDGVDGTSGTAGALVDVSFRRRAEATAITDALEGFDTGTLHLSAGTAIPAHPTGHNLADVHVLVAS